MSDVQRPTFRRLPFRWLARLKAVPSPLDDQRGGTTLEWAMLLLWIVLASYVLIRLSLYIITGHFGMVTTVNSLPFP